MIAVFYAMEGEIGEPLEGFSLEEAFPLKEWQKSERRRFRGIVREGKYRGREIVLAQTGIWKTGWRGYKGNTQAKEVANFVIERYRPEKIIVVGPAGGMKEELEVGNLVICEPIYAKTRCPVFPFFTRTKPPIYPDVRLTFLAIEILKEKGIAFRVGGDLQIPDYAWPGKGNPVLVVEMEDYFIGSVAASRKIPFLAVRVVSEPYSEDLSNPNPEYQALRVERFRRVTKILRDEFLLPFLQRL